MFKNTAMIEVKIKWIDDKLSTWESIPVMAQMTFKAFNSTIWNHDIWEIRYNLIDSPQGHYLSLAKFNQ